MILLLFPIGELYIEGNQLKAWPVGSYYSRLGMAVPI